MQNTLEAGVEREEAPGKRVATQAREAGVEHFVYPSVGSAHKRTGIPHFDNKWHIEETVPGLRFPSHVILRPVFFMENLLASYSLQGSCLWLMRWRGLPGWNSERNLLSGVLVGMPIIYVSRYLFASAGRMANYWFWVEVLGTITFVALAVLVRKRSPWFLAVGIVAHGLAWDAWHCRNSTYIPDWYATACLAVDLAFGAYVAACVPAYESASRTKMS